MDQRDIDRVQGHLKRTFGNPHIALKARPRQKDSADVTLRGESIGVVVQDEDDDGSFMFEMGVLAKDFDGVQAHLSRILGNQQIAAKPRPKQNDSAEVELNGEFIGVIYQDEDEDGSFMFEMAILAEDLET